jgi:hypothetical protein
VRNLERNSARSASAREVSDECAMHRSTLVQRTSADNT